MHRVVSVISTEGKAFELFVAARKDVFKFFRVSKYCSSVQQQKQGQTVLAGDTPRSGAPAPSACPQLPPLPPDPRPREARRAWTAAAAALTLTASLGGVYLYRKLNKSEDVSETKDDDGVPRRAPIPGSAASFPAHVHFLLVGAGTASFAAMRALRSARPDAKVLMVGDEMYLPYMRPPLSKELWREPTLPDPDGDLDALTFRQWNGRRRSVTYEPPAFYTPVERLEDAGGAAAIARGWRVARIDVERHEAELVAPGGEVARLRYDRCLVATGVRPRRAPALTDAAAQGRSLAVRGLRDVAELAAALERPEVRRVAVVGGGFLASELSAALAARMRDCGRETEVVQVFREEAPMAAVLPPYLAAEAGRHLREEGVRLRPSSDVVEAAVEGDALRLRFSSGEELAADLVVECIGSEVDDGLATASGLETHPQLGGLVVNGELQARTDVFAAGDAACFYDAALGRRRVEHHDHAVVSGRLAGENMAGVHTPKPYTHQSMFWSDLGPQLGYEAIGVIDSRLATVAVFSEEAVTEAGAEAAVAGGAPAGVEAGAAGRRFERGVVLYLREGRVVGVLLWNLFNRMAVARAVLAQARFDDLFEAAKLFSLHQDE